jgi:hypothetical protein
VYPANNAMAEKPKAMASNVIIERRRLRASPRKANLNVFLMPSPHR